jgi:zinc D-Ala-D-Ala dipeptidase
MKPYQSIAIVECDQPLVAISEEFAFADPHVYQALGAPYGERSPFYLRLGVLERLQIAQSHLQQIQPHWRILVFDAYRPIAVQQFMVEYTLAQQVTERGWQSDTLTRSQHDELMAIVLQFWALPSHDPKTPPPHSTGAAVDVTLIDQDGNAIDMGGAIDEISPRSFPNYYASGSSSMLPERAEEFHAHRQLLQQIMTDSGFQQHPNEWWHFSFGDQMWAWSHSSNQASCLTACYGRYE